MSAFDWSGLFWETRGYLGLDEDDPVPVDELVAQAEANGHTEREARDAIRDAEKLEAVGDLDDLRVRLADEDPDVSGETDEERAEEAGSPDEPEAEEMATRAAVAADIDTWTEIDFSETDPATYPPELLDVPQWMGRLAGEKMPFSPWADRDHPEAAPDEDARYKWGLSENYTDGETVAMAEDDPRLDGRVFIQREDDPYAFVDGDDVRDPDTGEIHPAFRAILDHLGVTYADVSSSGAGVHAYYRGELPIDGKGQATFDIDTEPWGANESPPAVEIYANKHVNITTGDHLVGTGTEVAEWDNDALRAILEANGYEDKPEVDHDTDRERDDIRDYNPGATDKDESTDEIRDILKAVDRLEPGDVRLDTSKTGADSTGWTTWNPSYRSSESGESLHYNDDGVFHDHKEGEAFGVLGLLAAEENIITDPWDELSGSDWWEAVEAARDDGAAIPRYDSADDSGDTFDDDPREVLATVDARRAWDAAGRVAPADLDTDALDTTEDGEAFACPACGGSVDVVRAVALAEELVDACDATLDGEYPEAYGRAREAYGAPLPEYYTTSDAIAEFDALLDLIGEVTFWHLDDDALSSEITQRDAEVDGEAVRALNPAWRESESEASVLVFDSGNIWDADSERTLDVLRFVALDSGLIDEPGDALEGELFTTAYDRARRVYGAPLPRWEPAEGGAREVTPQLPPSDELVDGCDLDGVDTDALGDAREEVETLIQDATAAADTPTVVTALPATGKTTGTVKTARDRPLSYLAPRKELQKQALEKADRWDVDAEVLPVFGEARVRDEVLNAAVSHVREAGKDRLRDRWAILAAAFDGLDTEDEKTDETPDLSDIFDEEDEDAVDLQRPTCDTAEGDHGVAWALAVHVARRLGYTPREIHQQAAGLFGAPLPCTCDDHGDETDAATCEYSAGWDSVSDPDDPADLLIGSYIHAHVDSAKTHFTRGPDGDVETSHRALVVDEYVGEAYSREFGEEAHDFATWLATCLRDDVEDRRDMFDVDLYGDSWVRAWLEGDGAEADGIGDAVASLSRTRDLLDAREAAGEILEEVDSGLLGSFDLVDPLERVADGDGDVRAVFRELADAIGAVDPEHPAAGIASWADDAVREPLDAATASGSVEPGVDGVDTDALPISSDLRSLVEAAVEAVAEGRDDARPRIDAAVTALQGDREGCRRLAAWADDGYAHPDAHHLLTNIITPTGEDGEPGASRVRTSSWAFDPDATDGTVVDVVRTGEKARTVVDRNDHGAILQTPPARVSAGGEDVPLVGLDATGRAELWANAIDEPVDTADIHDTPEERAEFLETALGLRVLQAADRPRSYEGDPSTKDTDGDVALLEAIAEEYAGLEAPRKRDEEPAPVGNPAAITTKGVRQLLEADSRLDDVVAEWENYGNLTGANDLGDHRLAAILGSQHYGDHAIERFCALDGREVDTDRSGGRGAGLEYGDDLADAYHKHMAEDQTMQAILRFTRGDSGATVVARTSALREDLPVVGRAQVVDTWSDTATTIAREYRRLGKEFTAADVADSVDVSRRQVRRVLAELVEAGYLRRVGGGDGLANVYEPSSEPGAGEVDLPERGDAVAPGGEGGSSPTNQYYTWNVRVRGGEADTAHAPASVEVRQRGAPPSPATVDGTEPPG